MRTLIVLILTLTIPASAYIAGCRQDRTAAAFPKAKELDKLAKAPQDDSSRPPSIPPAPIDRSILNLPEQPQRTTMARINAVDDQSRQLAGSRPPAGMFTLPESDTRLAQSSPVSHQSAPAALTPIPSAREFWSKQAPTQGRAVTPLDVPADVSAMMPSQPQPVLAPPSAPQSAASSFMQPPGTKLLPVESVPGVFDATNTSFRSGGPPERMSEARFPAPGGDALGAPLPSSQAVSGPLQLDLGGLIAPGQPTQTAARHFQPEYQPLPIVQSIPGSPVYEPLPEPIPLEQYNRMVEPDQRRTATAAPRLQFEPLPPAPEARPAPAREEMPAAVMPAPLPLPGPNAEPARKSAIPLLPIPDFKPAPAKPAPTPMDPPAVTNPRLATLLDSRAVREALAPLPDIAGTGSAAKIVPPPVAVPPQPPAAKAVPVALPTPMPAPLPSPELTAAKTALLNPVEPLDDPAKSVRDVPSRDLFRMDLPAAPAKQAEAERPSKPAATVMMAEEKPAAPQKVKLTPIRSRQRSDELGKIDAATEVPPLRF